MNRCLELAKLGAGNVSPNPLVGAVLVYNDKILGEGYHKKFSESHAEVNCIDSVKEEDKSLINKSTLYVSLEPCAHFGKTPPCADLIIKSKIPRVIIGCIDSFKEVEGKGIKKLENAGIEVTTGVLEKDCNEINKRFFTFHRKERPYIILKWAESVNGKIGTDNDRVLISNEYTNRLVHKWRSEEAAILVGTNTSLKDDPSLSTRLWKGNSPIRLVIDMSLRLPTHLKIFNKEIKTIIFNKEKQEDNGNVIFYKITEENIIPHILKALYELQIQSVIVEGGTTLIQSFIGEGLWDEIRIIRNETLIIEKGIDSPVLINPTLQKQEKIFNDTLSYFVPSF